MKGMGGMQVMSSNRLRQSEEVMGHTHLSLNGEEKIHVSIFSQNCLRTVSRVFIIQKPIGDFLFWIWDRYVCIGEPQTRHALDTHGV